jgi:hypothetical protein
VHRSLPVPRITAVSLLTAAVAVVAAAPAVAQAPNTITFREVNKGSKFTYVDNPPKAKKSHGFPVRFSAGDSFAFVTPIKSNAGARLGALRAKCDVVAGGKPDKAATNCSGVFHLHGGSIFVAVESQGNSTTGVIYGGTGTYAGKRGTFVSKETKTGANDTITLLP